MSDAYKKRVELRRRIYARPHGCALPPASSAAAAFDRGAEDGFHARPANQDDSAYRRGHAWGSEAGLRRQAIAASWTTQEILERKRQQEQAARYGVARAVQRAKELSA